jgi:hypothetical protein
MWTTLFAGSAFAQSLRSGPDSQPKGVAPESEPGRPETKGATEEPRPSDLKGEVDTLKAETAVVRELLRKMEEQQKILLD